MSVICNVYIYIYIYTFEQSEVIFGGGVEKWESICITGGYKFQFPHRMQSEILHKPVTVTACYTITMHMHIYQVSIV